MVINHRVTGRAMSMPAGLALGASASFVVTMILSGILAYLIGNEKLGENAVGYGAMIILLLSSWVGAFLAVNRIKRQRLLVSCLSGAIYFIILLCMTALFFGGQYQGMGVTALVIIAGAGLVILAGIKGERSVKRKHRKNRKS